MLGAAEDGVEDGFGGEDVGAGADQRFEAGGGVFGAAAAGGVGEDRDLEVVIDGVEGGLVDADRGFDAAEDEVLDVEGFKGVADAVVGEGGESAFAELVGLGGELEERGDRGAEFLRDLLGEGDVEAEDAGALDGEGGAAGEGGGVHDFVEEDFLHVDTQEERAGEGGESVGHLAE